jgi:anti-sigma factor RsiW
MSSQLSHHEIEELLGAFALDAIDGDERDVVEAHLAGCPRCRAEVAGYRETAAMLAHGGTRAPEGVWAQIAGALDEPPPQLDMARIVPFQAPAPASPGTEKTERKDRSRWSRRSVSLRAAAATVALAAAFTAFLGVRVGRQDARLDRIDTALRNGAIRSAAAAAMADPSAEEIKLASFDGHAGARLVRQADGTGFLWADTLAPLPSDRTYQLWAVRSDAKISLGVLGNRPGVSPFRIAGPVLGYAVTEEAAGGVAASQNTPVVVGYVKPKGEGGALSDLIGS